jgi:hypothetical protein
LPLLPCQPAIDHLASSLSHVQLPIEFAAFGDGIRISVYGPQTEIARAWMIAQDGATSDGTALLVD